MIVLVGMPQGAEWLIILGFAALCLAATVALFIWLTVMLTRRRT